MSKAEYAEINRPTHSTLGGRKREACDRCHGQKLRCIFQDESQESSQQTCIRCEKAGADCATRIAGRAGRPRLVHFIASEGQKEGGRGKRKRQRHETVSNIQLAVGENSSCADNSAEGWRTNFERHNSGYHVSGNDEDNNIGARTQAMSSLPLQDAPNLPERSSLDFPTLLWSEETLPPFFSDDTGDGLSLIAPDLEFDWNSQEQQARLVNVQNLASSVSSSFIGRRPSEVDVDVDVHGSSAENNSIDADVGGMSEDSTHFDEQNEPVRRESLTQLKLSRAKPPQVSDHNSKDAAASLGSAVDPRADVAAFMNIAGEHAGSKFSGDVGDAHHRRMRTLSEFAVDLHAQVSDIEVDSNQPVSAITSTTLRDQLIGSVLKSSIAFSKLLNSFSAPTTSPTPPSTPSSVNFTMSNNRNKFTSSPSDGSTPSAASAIISERTIGIEQLHHQLYSSFSQNSSSEIDKPPVVDITIILQLVICYIRIVHLHGIMYRRILDYLLALSLHRAHSILPVFPGMQVGGVSLDIFATFQIKLLVQISVHVLGGIEVALGVPERYRIGRRKGGARPPLDSHLSGDFVECLMRENAWRGQNVEAVRKHLRDLGEVLESSGLEL